MGGDKFLIGLDLGTSAIKGVLLRQDGFVAATAGTLRRYDHPGSGVVEFDAEGHYAEVAETLRALAAKLPRGGQVAALALASASGNTVLTDKAGRALAPAISWLDERLAGEMERVLGELPAEEVHAITGWPKLNSFPLAHLSWLRVHRPELLDGAHTICMSTEYIIHRLTGRWATDPSTATPFYLTDQAGGRWHGPYLQKLGIPLEKLPALRPSGTAAGPLLPGAAEALGLPCGLPVVLGAFDHPSAARGVGVLRPGQMLLSCGTSWVGFYPVEDRDRALRAGLLVDPFLRPAGPWGAMFSLPAIAQSIEAYIDEAIGPGPGKFARFEALAASATPGAGGLMLNPAAEHRHGLLEYHSQAQVCRALVEGVAFLVRRKMEDLAAMGIRAGAVSMAGGPSESALWPQVLADVLGREIAVTNGQSAGAVGAALLAGIGARLYEDEADALQKCSFERRVFTPNCSARAAYDRLFEAQR